MTVAELRHVLSSKDDDAVVLFFLPDEGLDSPGENYLEMEHIQYYDFEGNAAPEPNHIVLGVPCHT